MKTKRHYEVCERPDAVELDDDESTDDEETRTSENEFQEEPGDALAERCTSPILVTDELDRELAQDPGDVAALDEQEKKNGLLNGIFAKSNLFALRPIEERLAEEVRLGTAIQSEKQQILELLCPLPATLEYIVEEQKPKDVRGEKKA